MKKLRWSTLLGLALLSGCAHHYEITLTNGNTMTTSSKPKVNKTGDAFVFKDANGVMASVPRSKVREIAPR